MGLLDQMVADSQAVADAEAALHAAQAKLEQTKAAVAAIDPHLNLWQEVENSARKFGGDVENELLGLVGRARQFLGV